MNLLYFFIAGGADPVVNFAFGEMTSALLHTFCTKYQFKKYPDMAHSSSPQVS